MDLNIWNEEYSVGIETIDEQHKELVCMINTLYDALAEGKTSEVQDDILNGLLDYSDRNFTYEEDLFNRYDYPDAEIHRKEHACLDDRLVGLKSRLEVGNLFLGEVVLLKLLQDWLINHVMKSDRRLGDFLIEKGVK